MTRQWPARFAGLATLPVQDVGAAMAELERAVNALGLKGAEFDTVIMARPGMSRSSCHCSRPRKPWARSVLSSATPGQSGPGLHREVRPGQ